MTATNNTAEQVANAYHALTGERFCTECQMIRKVSAGGIWRVRGKVRRWQCAACIERRKNLTPSKSR